MSMQTPCRTLLLVDDEENIVKSLKRALRSEGYQIYSANSGAEALDLLAKYEVGVIVSDQRMPLMSGVEFLRRVKKLYPKTLRIVLSGFTEMETITSAVNEGFIYKFLFKPWDDEQLRINLRKAFDHYELERENQRLNKELRLANKELEKFNHLLAQQVQEKTTEANKNINLLQISQEILEHLPIAVIGIDEQGMVAVSNRLANELLRRSAAAGIVGLLAHQVLPEAILQMIQRHNDWEMDSPCWSRLDLAEGKKAQAWVSSMGEYSSCKGIIVAFTVCQREGENE